LRHAIGEVVENGNVKLHLNFYHFTTSISNRLLKIPKSYI
jgi:hypothetical protein